MSRRPLRVLAALLAVCAVVALAGPVAAHVPGFPTDNTGPTTAVEIDDAAKSYSFYDRLGPGEGRYYRLTLDAGERLHVGTFTPAGGAFAPSVAVFRPGATGTEPLPPGVEAPSDWGADVVHGVRPASPSYEPFAPSANYHTVRHDTTVDRPTTALVAIFESGNRSGPVGVVVGYEERFEPVEYVRVAVDRVRIHAWSDHSPVLFLGPAVLVAVLGAYRYRRRLHQFSRRPAAAVATAAGIAVVASAANTAVQRGQALARTEPTPAAVLTLVFVLVPLGVGWWAVSVAPETPDRRRRLGLGLAALLAFVMWSGYVVAPLALLAAALAPARWFDDVTRAAR